MQRVLPVTLLLFATLPGAARVLRVPEDYSTLALALFVNQPGDTVELAAGTHAFDGYQPLDQQLTLRGLGMARLLLSNSLHCHDSVLLEGLELRFPGGTLLEPDNRHVALAGCRLVAERLYQGSYASLSLAHCRLDSLTRLGSSLQSPPVVFYQCELRDLGCLDQSSHPGLLFESCLLERVEQFGDRGWVSWDEGEIRFHGCTLVDCGGMGTSLDFLELERCLVVRPQGSLLGEGVLEPDLFEIRQTDIWSGEGNDWTGALEPLLGVYGNIEADPLFCDAPADYRLSAGSPCVLDSLGTMWMGACALGCGPLIQALTVVPLGDSLPQRVSFHAELLGDFESLEWDVDGDGQPEGLGSDFEWSWELPGDYQVLLRVRAGGQLLEQASPPVHVGGQVRDVADVEQFRTALAAAQPQDLIRLGPGRYPVVDLSVPPGVVLAGTPGGTVLDAEQGGCVLRIRLDARFLLLQDLILTGGATDAGGALVLDAASESGGRLTVRRCEFRGNDGGYEGGALAQPRPDLGAHFDSCRFQDNRARRGGALSGYGFELSACTFSGNRADAEGGAACFADSSVVTDCRFLDNQAARGGALALEGPARVADALFLGNRATERGGAVWNEPWAGTRGGSYARCLFVGNGAGLGGGALWDHAGPRLTRCTFAFDSTTADGAVVDLASPAEGEPVRVAGCLLTLSRGGCGLQPGDGILDVSCTDLWGNSGGDWLGSLAGLENRDGNRRVDPRYCLPASGDFHLQANSPCGPAADSACGGLGALSGSCEDTGLPPASVRPAGPRLAPPWPNPFNPDCWLEFELARPGPVRLRVVNLAGQEVACLCDETLGAGLHRRILRGGRLASGVYLARLETAEGGAVRKLLLLK